MYAHFPDTNGDGDYEDDFSISIWAKSSVNADEALIAFGVNDALYTGMISRIGTNISFNSSNWGFAPTASTSGKKSDGPWHHYVFVYNAQDYRKIFIDGSLVEQDNQPGSGHLFNFKTYGVSIGKERYTPTDPGDLSNTYTGSVDDVRIWNAALSGSEVLNLYHHDMIPVSPTTTKLNTYGEYTTISSNHVNKNGAIGTGSGLDDNGKIKN
jgi:hypothetical protein